jgi:hypothetical protein
MEMITHLNLGKITLEVEYDYEQPTYAYFGDLEALTEPKAESKSVLFYGVDENNKPVKVNVLDLIHELGLYNELNLILVANMEAIDE